MHKLRTTLPMLATGLFLAVAAGAQQFEELPAAKPTTPAPAAVGQKIGLIDIQGAMARTQEGEKATEDLQARFGPRQAELQKLQEEIRDLENQLRTQERTLSNEARVQLRRQIEQKTKQATRMEQDLRDEAQQAQTDYINRIGEKMQRIIDQYAQEKNLSVIFNVFPGGPIIYATSAMDITDDIVRLYDQAHPVETTATSDQSASPGSQPPQRRQPRN